MTVDRTIVIRNFMIRAYTIPKINSRKCYGSSVPPFLPLEALH